MSSSIKSGRVSKTKVKSPSQLSRVFSKQMAKEQRKPKPLPLVERTNQLPLDQFISSYVPQSLLEISSRKTQDANDSGSEESPDYKMDIYTANSIPDADFEACFKLVEGVSDDYEKLSTGWSPSKKRKEMRLPDMKYIILRRCSRHDVTGNDDVESPQEEGEALGFTSFMVTYEDGYEVVYLYEIHLSSAVQGQGLGKQLMLKLEDIGRHIGLEKIMLTVFKSNTVAMGLYNRVGYTVDEFSPPPKILRNGTVKESSYLILSKSLRTTSACMN
ncbi:hypothetical protein AWENTII_004206 [Aspergillus wentii]